MERNVYYRTDRAAVDQSPSTREDRVPGTQRMLWAKVPYQTRRGRCVALKVVGDQLLVGIAAAPAVQWLPVEKVFTEAEARAWLRTSFA